MLSFTRLRYVRSKDPEKILEYVNSMLAYKIEIKGSPSFVKGKWYLWFVLPENKALKEAFYGDID